MGASSVAEGMYRGFMGASPVLFVDNVCEKRPKQTFYFLKNDQEAPMHPR